VHNASGLRVFRHPE